MAPRGRRRPKKRNTRMDAAIDAMKGNYGFDEALVRATVQDLLEIYTEEGWCLIEENYYSVLLEAILEKNKAAELHQGGEDIGQSSAGPSTLPALPPIPDAVDDILPLNFSAANREIDDLPGSKGAESQNSRQGLHGDDPSNTLSAPPPCSRKPYHGWISANDDEDAERDLVDLPRMPLDEFMRQYYLRSKYHQQLQRNLKRKLRWDIKPDSQASS